MPIFEYVCRGCGKPFEVLMRSGTDVECPSCHDSKVEKKFSVFAFVNSAESASPDCSSGCGGFGEGACGSGMCPSHIHD